MKKHTYNTAFLAVFLTLPTFLSSCGTNHQLNCDGEDGVLQQALDNNNEAAVLAAIDRGADVNASCPTHRRPPLHRAASLGYLRVVTELLDRGVSVDSRDAVGSTLLHSAAYNGHPQVVQLLLHRGATMESQNNYGYTPLNWAVIGGRHQIVQLLLQQGATVDSQNNYGITPLHEAVRHGHTQIVQLLLQHGAELDSQESNGSTPLHWAVSNGHTQMVRLLLQRGATVDIQDNNGETPLMSAIRNNYAQGKVSLFKLLIAQPQNFHLTNFQGKTALEIAEDRFRAAAPAHRKFYSLIIAMIKNKM